MSGGAPSSEYLSLVRTSLKELGKLMIRGEQPEPANLIGSEYRGTNVPITSALLGIRRFVKGFVAQDAAQPNAKGPLGYNKSVRGTDLKTEWRPSPQRDGRLAWAWFTVRPVDAESVDNRFLNSLLLDYGAVPRPERGIPSHIRDYLVRVDPLSDDLLLGQAFLAFGSQRVPVGWFALERLGPVGGAEIGGESASR